MPTAKWWINKAPKGVNQAEWDRDRAQALLDETAAIENRQQAWHQFNLWNSTLFYNRELPAFRWGDLDAEEELAPADLRTENLVCSIGEAMLSKACSQPLVPSPVPHGASYTAKKAVERLQRFIGATWIQTAAERAATQAFLDAFVCGIGAVRICHESNKLSVEPIFYDNIIIDNRECVNRTAPRTIRIRTVTPRASVEAKYGEFGYDQQQSRAYTSYREVGTDWVVVVEAIRKPDSKGQGGWRCIASCGKILDEGPWSNDWVDIVFLHYSDPGSGFFCKSGVEQVIPYQVAQNELNDAIKKAQDICCRPRIITHANSNLDINQWDTEFGRILGYTGTEPKPFVWQTNISDLYNERERNRASAYSYFGISEMSASADLPQQVRLDSSAGVREFRNMEDSRHLRLWTRYEDFRLEIAHRLIDVLSETNSKYGVASVSYMNSGRASTEMISWQDIKEIRKEQYSWTLEAVPLSSQSPAARRETLQAWQAQGKINPADDINMIGNPDLEKIESQEMAGVDEVHRQFGLMERGEAVSPPEYTNFTYGIPACVQNINILKSYTDGVHEDAIMLHEQWMLEAMNTQKTAVMALEAQMTPPPQAPGFDPNMGVQGQIQ